MKTRILLLLVMCFIMSAPSYAEEVPAIVTQGLDAYKASTYTEAFRVWLKGSPLDADKTTAMNLLGAFTQIESAYGKFTGYDILRIVALSRSTIRVYVEIRYEKGPLFAFFECYNSPKGWIIPTVRFHMEADKLLPDDFFRKR